jgi:predicted Rossmann fold nucleotide-binding protein DprA/Smf involved in DNA uptake
VAVEPEDAVLQELAPGEVVELDALALRMGLDGQTVMARVSQLEVEGWVQRVPGGRILRLSRKW